MFSLISARWPLLTSLSLHIVLVLAVMQLTLSSNTHSLPNILLVDIIEEKKVPEAERAPVPLFKKKERIPPVEKKEEKKSSPLPKLEEKIITPPVVPKEETKPEEMRKEEASLGEQKNLEEQLNPVEAVEKSLRKDEKPEESSAPVPGTKASAFPLEPSEKPGKLSAFKGATWLGEMRGVGKEGSGGEKSGEGPEKRTARVGESVGRSSLGEGKGRADLLSYLAALRMRIEKAKRYPPEARRKGYEGRVIVSFKVDRKGKVGEIKLVQSCGHPELDEEGMATLRRASPFPSPLLIEKEQLALEVPLLFKIEEEK